jgi:hypothetical protein
MEAMMLKRTWVDQYPFWSQGSRSPVMMKSGISRKNDTPVIQTICLGAL